MPSAAPDGRHLSKEGILMLKRHVLFVSLLCLGVVSVSQAATIEFSSESTHTSTTVGGHVVQWHSGLVTPHDTESRAAALSYINATGGQFTPTLEGASLDLYLAAPDGYDFQNPGEQRYPLVIYLHGAGGNGSHGDEGKHLSFDQLNYWTDPAVQAIAPGGGAFVLAPQITESNKRWVEVGDNQQDYDVDGWNNDEIVVSRGLRLALTAAAGLVSGGTSELPSHIDPSRVYIVGQSMGGFGTWDAIARVSDAGGRSELAEWLELEHAAGGDLWQTYQFAGAMPTAGSAPQDRGIELASVPTWLQAHLDDTLVPAEGTLKAAQAIRDALSDPDAVYETSDVYRTLDGLGTEPINEHLAELLAYNYLLTMFQGDAPDAYSGDSHPAHSWVVSDAMLTAEELDMARWLFAHSVPSPSAGACLLAGLGLMLIRRGRRAAPAR